MEVTRNTFCSKYIEVSKAQQFIETFGVCYSLEKEEKEERGGGGGLKWIQKELIICKK